MGDMRKIDEIRIGSSRIPVFFRNSDFRSSSSKSYSASLSWFVIELIMGGHGGLNILPQKHWNVYNYKNREKVRRDEEEAARGEQLKCEQVRKRDAECRLERLRTARGLAPLNKPQEPGESEPKSSH